MNEAVLEVVDLKKSYGNGEQRVNALGGVSFTVGRGELTAIMGPSGSGKSTLLHLLGGLDAPTSGRVRIGGVAIESMKDRELSVLRRTKIGFVFQFFHLLPTLTVLENVCLPVLLDGRPIAGVEARAKELLTHVGLAKRLEHRPDQLSGGEMQRVAIARALVADPPLLLADEPTGNLDTKTGEAILGLLADLQRARGFTVVMVTHDPKATRYAGRLLALRDGQIEYDGPPDARS
jgi:putative ABC transport system ATP-binding protein